VTKTIKTGWRAKLFDSEEGNTGLPVVISPKAVVGRFTAESAAALWVAGIFGEGAYFWASWQVTIA
jgi:hypothetical protein